MTDERLSSALEEIRAEAFGSIGYAGDHDCPDSGSSCSAHHTLRLLAAVEAVLKLADGARCVDDVYNTESDAFDPVAWNLDPAKIRETITLSLAGDA